MYFGFASHSYGNQFHKSFTVVLFYNHNNTTAATTTNNGKPTLEIAHSHHAPGFETLVPMLYEHQMQLCKSSNSKIQQCYASIRWAQPWNYSIHSNNNSRFVQNAIPMGLASLQSRDPWSLQHQTKASFEKAKIATCEGLFSDQRTFEDLSKHIWKQNSGGHLWWWKSIFHAHYG